MDMTDTVDVIESESLRKFRLNFETIMIAHIKAVVFDSAYAAVKRLGQAHRSLNKLGSAIDRLE